MPPPAAARHTTTERDGGEQRAGPERCLVSGCRPFSCTWFGDSHRFNSLETPSVFPPLAQVHGAASGCARPHANERAIWRP